MEDGDSDAEEAVKEELKKLVPHRTMEEFAKVFVSFKLPNHIVLKNDI